MAEIKDIVDRVQELSIDVGILKKESEIQTRILEKQDIVIDSLRDLTQAMHVVISVHEEKLKNLQAVESTEKKTSLKDENGKIDILKIAIDNWKYILFAVAFGGGIITHKWGLFSALFS